MSGSNLDKKQPPTSEILTVSSLILFFMAAGSSATSSEVASVLKAVVSWSSPVGDSAELLPTGDMLTFSFTTSESS